MTKKTKNRNWFWPKVFLVCGFFVGLASFLNDSTGFVERYIFKSDRHEYLKKNFEKLNYYKCKEPHEFSKEEITIGTKLLYSLFDSIIPIKEKPLSIIFFPSENEISLSDKSPHAYKKLQNGENLICSLFCIADVTKYNKIFYFSTKNNGFWQRAYQPHISVVFVDIDEKGIFKIRNKIKYALQRGVYNSEPNFNFTKLGKLGIVTIVESVYDRYGEGNKFEFFDEQFNKLLEIEPRFDNRGWTDDIEHITCYENNIYTIYKVQKDNVPTLFVENLVYDTKDCQSVKENQILVFEYSNVEENFINITFKEKINEK